MNVPNFINFIYVIRFKLPLSFVECDWASLITIKRQGVQQSIAEICRSIMSPPWGVTERAEAQTIVARPSPVATWNFKTASRRRNMERQWRQPVACSRNSTARPICSALDGDSQRCQYAYLQSSTIGDALWSSMAIFHWHSMAEVLTISKLPYSHRCYWRRWRLLAITHGCVCALWHSTAFIHGFGTASECRQKTPMCNSGFSRWGILLTNGAVLWDLLLF